MKPLWTIPLIFFCLAARPTTICPEDGKRIRVVFLKESKTRIDKLPDSSFLEEVDKDDVHRLAIGKCATVVTDSKGSKWVEYLRDRGAQVLRYVPITEVEIRGGKIVDAENLNSPRLTQPTQGDEYHESIR